MHTALLKSRTNYKKPLNININMYISKLKLKQSKENIQEMHENKKIKNNKYKLSLADQLAIPDIFYLLLMKLVFSSS